MTGHGTYSPARRWLASAAVVVAIGAICIATLGATPSIAHGRVACNRVASRHGSDRHSGTRAHPFRTVQRLIDALRPGQRGCLLGGVFHGSVRFNHGGLPGAPITLTSWPGRHSTVAGRIYIPQGSNDITVAFLHLVGRNRGDLPSPTVNAAAITFAFDNVTTHHNGICFALGSLQLGAADDVTITHSRIHGCGHLPPGNHQHGIYLDYAVATVISHNFIYDNADRGINLYPAATASRIYGNVIEGNGEGVLFAGDGGHASSGNVVWGNIIAFSRVRSNVESNWLGPVGLGNVVTGNCIWGAHGVAVDAGSGGFLAFSNILRNPRFALRHPGAAGNFRLRRHSPCARLHAG